MTKKQGFATRAIHSGQEPDHSTGAVIPAISLSTNFVFPRADQPNKYDYTRVGNPNRTTIETAVASLEEGKYACAFASGCSVTSAVISTLDAGSHVICINDVYSGTYNILTKIATKHLVETSFVDMSNPDNVKPYFRPNTKLVWMESPTNPTMRIPDIAAIAKHARDNDALLVVDNTFMTPYFQNPLSLGADIVMHSATKYINGHSDVLMGLAVTNNKEIYDQLHFMQCNMGAVPSSFDCYLARRGLMTLAIRMKAHEANAQALAEFMEKHPAVDEVLYPGLPSHPQHDIAKRQMKGFGGMLSFRLKGNLMNVNLLTAALKVFTLAESLGGLESLLQIPSLMTHKEVKKEQRLALGITDTLIRVSVGIEDLEDLIDDMDQALTASQMSVEDLEKALERLKASQ